MKAKPRYKASELYNILLNKFAEEQLENHNDCVTEDEDVLTLKQFKASIRDKYPTLVHLIECMADNSWDVESAFGFLLETVASGNIGDVSSIPGAHSWDT